MAELRSAENGLLDVVKLYESIRSDERLGNLAPPPLKASITLDSSSDKNKTEPSPPSSYRDLLNTLETTKQKLEDQRPNMERFRKRLAEKDPVTDKPRYGEKTQQRVSILLALFKELDDILKSLFGVSETEKDEKNTFNKLISHLQMQADREKTEADELARWAALEEQKRLARVAEQERELLEQKQREAQEAKRAQHKQEEETRRQEEEIRQAERRRRQEEDQRDRDWVNSIVKGTDGVKEQLSILLESTSGDKLTQRVAIEALRAIFHQICARPEEPNFRRIRRNHPKFNEDIGRYAGGKEILIAAGFELGEIDGVPSYISKEPDLESDMDRWSSWFDLLKATLGLLDEQLKQM
ncbi:hypothetical protein ACA910_010783 [Epithemia clementina (nom. ined.)]